MQLRTSRETLYEPLSEEQDDGDSFSEDKMPLSSLAQENMQSALLFPTTMAVDQRSEVQDCGILETQGIACPKKAIVPLLQEEEEEGEEEMATPASCEQSQVSWTLQVDHDTSIAPANRTESGTSMASGEEAGVVQIHGSPPAIPTTQAEPPATISSSTPSPVPLFHLKVNGNPVAMHKGSMPVLGQVTSPQSRSTSLSRVSELKKRFEA